MPRGRVTRVAPLVGMAGRTTGEAVAASLRKRRNGELDLTEHHTRQAQRYAERLGRSRGVLMKAGQMLSLVTLDGAVDAPYRGIYQAAFARLQDDAPPMPPEVAAGVVRAELGREPAELFVQFDPHPLAAASIGQVHAATLRDGRRVAVKVQYPGVADAIRADLANAELLATFFSMLFTVVPGLLRIDARGMAREVSARIGEEVDYRIEAVNQQDFADLHRNHPFIRVPEVVPELSTQRVLTMELVEGLRYAQAVTAEQSLRDAWGEAIFRFVWGNLIGRGVFNADPHPGNYLFHPDGSVTFLDFGCVKRFGPGLVARLEATIQAAVEQDAEKLMAAAIAGGAVDPNDPPDPRALLDVYTLAARSLIADQPFTYTPEFAGELTRSGSPRGAHWAVARKLGAPPDYAFITRIDTGINAVLGGLRATGFWRAIRAEYHGVGPPATAYGKAEAAWRSST